MFFDVKNVVGVVSGWVMPGGGGGGGRKKERRWKTLYGAQLKHSMLEKALG